MNGHKPDDDNKTEEEEDKDKQIQQLKRENTALRKMCTALKELSDQTKTTNTALRKQNLKLQKQLVECFAAIGLLQEKLEEEKNANNEDENGNEEETEEISCSLCFGEIEQDDLIILNECGHKFHSQCIYQCIQTDVGIYKKLPVCGVCDVDGLIVKIPTEICKDLITKQEDNELLAEFEKIVSESQ